ncbi:MAG: Na+/H+ antiporter subunit E [bacterium]
MKTGRSFLLIWLILMVVWIVLNNSLHIQVILVGIVVVSIIAALFASKSDVFACIRLNPKALLYTLIFFFVFLRELVKANLDVALRVVSPTIRINPGIVEVKTRLTSPLARLALANSITLTPGTLSVDIQGDTLFVHWIDVTATDAEQATKIIAATFEKYLEVIYG